MSSMSDIAKKIVDSWTGVFYYPADNELFECLYDAYCKLDDQNHNFYSVWDEAIEEAEKFCEQNGLERCYTEAKDRIENVSAKTCREFYTGTCKKAYKKTCEKVYEKAYRKLVNWYHDKYPTSKEDSSGIDRKITLENIENGTYNFAKPLTSAPFRKYLIKGNPLRGNDARSFILHTAVAFLLSPEQLDHLLVTFGFHPLHVRNIHDMAIYVVLRDATKVWTSEERRELNPFREVRVVYEAARMQLIQTQSVEPREPSEEEGDECSQEVKDIYKDARKLLNRTRVAESRELSKEEQDAFLSNSTRIVQQYIHSQNLARENLLPYVGSHTEFYNLRHRRLLAEHKKLVSLFSELYMRGDWEGDEPKYSLYEFITAYCKEFERKRFHHHIYGEIVREDKRHPTRELMIVLWIYAYSFLFCPKVVVPCDFGKIAPFKEIDRNLGIQPEYPFVDFYDKNLNQLNVLKYLSDAMYDGREGTNSLGRNYDGWGAEATFSGKELVAFINGRLQSYSWRSLDGKNAFDRTVLSLSPLQATVSRDNTSCKIQDAFYGGEQIDDAKDMSVGDVPGSLVMIFKFLQEMKAIGNQFTTDLNDVRMPLPCSMYELI